MNLLKLLNLENIKSFWSKWNWLICLLLLVYSAYKTFSPPHEKIVEKTVTKTVVDTEAIQKFQNQIVSLKETIQTMSRSLAQIKEINKNIQVDEVITEVKYPDSRIEKRTEIKRRDLSTSVTKTSETVTSATNRTESSSGTYTTEISSKSHTDTSIESSRTTIRKPIPFWSTIIGYQYFQKECILGQGINIGNHFTIGIVGSYSFNHDVKRDNYGDIGAMIILRY